MVQSREAELFPHPTFRENQFETLQVCLEALDNGFKNIVIDAPTGTGKSPINTALLRYADDGWYTTPQKSLRQQIQNDEALEPYVEDLKARSDYYCSHGGTNSKDCDIYQSKDDSCAQTGCNYWKRKQAVMNSDIAVITFSMMIVDGMIPTYANDVQISFDDRDMIVVDECIPKGQAVLTEYGYRKIEEVAKEEVFSKKKDTLCQENSSQSKKTQQKRCMNIETNSTSFECSSDHELFNGETWKEAQDINKIAVTPDFENDRTEKEIKASLLGYAIGDGWLSENETQLGFSGDRQDLLRIKRDMATIGFDTDSKIYKRENIGGTANQSNGTVDINGNSLTLSYSTNAWRYFKNKLSMPVGDKTIQNIRVPQWVRESSTGVKASFISGLMGAEGDAINISHSHSFSAIRFYRNSIYEKDEFIEDIQKILNELEIESTIERREGNIREKDGEKTHKHQLRIESNRENILHFLKKISYKYCIRKEVKSIAVRNFFEANQEKINSLEDKIEWAKEYYLSEKEDADRCPLGTWDYIEKKVGLDKSLIDSYIRRDIPNIHPEMPTIEEWVEQRQFGDFVIEEIKNKTDVGVKDCYDISVPETENYIVNGAVVHNCHGLIEQTREMHAGVDITPYGLPAGILDGVTNSISWEADRFDDVAQELEIIRQRCVDYARDVMPMEMSPKEKRCYRLAENIKRIQDEVDNDNPWVVDVDGKNYNGEYWKTLELRPINVSGFLKNAIWNRANKRIISTATLRHRNNPAIWLNKAGLDPDKTKVISVGMTFPPENRPVITKGMIDSFSSGGDKDNWDEIMASLDDIAGKFYGERGICHTSSYNRAKKVEDTVESNIGEYPNLENNIFVHQEDEDAEVALEDWLASDCDMILSPSMMEGIDLKGDKGRYNILMKIPYPSRNSWTQYLLDETKYGWGSYFDRAAIRVAQAYGRTTRSKDDWSNFIILDEDYEQLKKKTTLPEWFTEAEGYPEVGTGSIFDY